MDAEHEIEAWNTRWAITAGRAVCTDCMQSQALEECDTPFAHDPECKAATGGDQQPWADLHCILDGHRG
jgi:hypothetical protein